MSTRIYGHSDDVVVFEIDGPSGKVCDEVGVGHDEDVKVIIGGAVVVGLRYSALAPGSACWSVEISQVGEDTQIPFPVTVTSKCYSAVAEIGCPYDTEMEVWVGGEDREVF